LAIRAGKPAYATAVSRSDVAAGWRQRREQGGCLLDVQANAVVLANLSMPHSPRWYRERLWLLNSGTGDLGYFDPQCDKFVPVAFCPGYLRGLAFWRDWAIVGMSKPRRERTFSGLVLDNRLQSKDAEARCGFAIVNLTTGNIDHWVSLEGVITELYDLQVIPTVTRAMSVGFRTDEILKLITLEAMPTSVARSDHTLETSKPPSPEITPMSSIFPNSLSI
ncbi:MAG: DUF4915 domain-containing protein, partial [Spirulinaceae cyanobacterium RM2_2_10]|nr:DUF4915 domain-containing protein [Spirulinaceae cyanobacterium RM2_2_10]